jgi:FAD/FMN-containing dehydrogenase
LTWRGSQDLLVPPHSHDFRKGLFRFRRLPNPAVERSFAEWLSIEPAPALLDQERMMAPNRRALLRAGVGFTAACATWTDGMTDAAQADSCDWPVVGGAFDCAPKIRAAAASDFGHILHKEPRAVFRPASAAGVASLMQRAGKQGLKIAARGQGHSTYGRSMAEDGIVVDMSAISTVHAVQPDRVVVDAGATWKSVLDATLPRGLTPPVLTNYLGLSVGGTIAVGGIGGSSSRSGMQTDHVLELDVVTGDGRELTCSATSNADLFDTVRAGLGQCGIVTRATLRLVRAPDRVRRFQLFYRDLASLVGDQRRALAAERFDQLQGAVLPDSAGGWRYQLDGAVFYNSTAAPDDKETLASLSDDRSKAVVADLTYRDDAHAFAKLESLLRSNGQWFNPQPWFFSFLRGSNAEQVAGEIIGGLTNADVGPFGRVTFYPMRTSAVRTPLVGLPEEEIAFPFNLVRIPPSNDAAKAAHMIAQNRAIYDRIRDAGGVHYPVSAIPLSSADWKDHLGSAWPRLHAAKLRYDPGNLLTPGYNVF